MTEEFKPLTIGSLSDLKEVLDGMELECPTCKTLLRTAFFGYRINMYCHDGGHVLLKGKRMWVTIECNRCKMRWSVGKFAAFVEMLKAETSDLEQEVARLRSE